MVRFTRNLGSIGLVALMMSGAIAREARGQAGNVLPPVRAVSSAEDLIAFRGELHRQLESIEFPSADDQARWIEKTYICMLDVSHSWGKSYACLSSWQADNLSLARAAAPLKKRMAFAIMAMLHQSHQLHGSSAAGNALFGLAAVTIQRLQLNSYVDKARLAGFEARTSQEKRDALFPSQAKLRLSVTGGVR